MKRMYTKTHEWINFIDDKTAYIGISDHAQKELGDLVYVSLPSEGEKLEMVQSFAEAESVKAVSEIYSPVSGIVTEVNEAVSDKPELINEQPYEAWLVKAGEITQTAELLTEEEYNSFLSEE